MKKRMFTSLMLGLLLTLAMTVTAMAGQWKLDSVGWWYQNDDGSYSVNAWQWIDGNNDGVAECYYFDNVGYMWTNKSLTTDGYRVDANGAWIVNGAVQTKQVQAAAAPAVTETAQQTEDYSGTFGIYDYGTGTYTNTYILTIKKKADNTYHLSCNNKYAPFEFDAPVLVTADGPTFSDPSGYAYVLYSPYTKDYNVLAGATMEAFGEIK